MWVHFGRLKGLRKLGVPLIICKKESESTPGGSLHGGPQEWMVYNGKSMKIPKHG